MGASRSATATARPRRRRRSATRPASRSSPARWAARCPATPSRCSTRSAASRPTRARSRSTSRSARSGLMTGYRGGAERSATATRGGYYRTGDVASRDADGYITYVGRTDDVFKASDYRISPFELESVLIEHEAVAEAAVVPVARPDAPRGAQGVRDAGRRPRADARDGAGDLALRARAPRAVQARPPAEFAELPKTISGKIRRVELRAAEQSACAAEARHPTAHRASSGRRTSRSCATDFAPWVMLRLSGGS